MGVGAANEVELFVILSPVGPYFAGGLKPVSLLADPRYVRAWQGGCGYVKMGSNYAPTLWTQVGSLRKALVDRLKNFLFFFSRKWPSKKVASSAFGLSETTMR